MDIMTNCACLDESSMLLSSKHAQIGSDVYLTRNRKSTHKWCDRPLTRVIESGRTHVFTNDRLTNHVANDS